MHGKRIIFCPYCQDHPHVEGDSPLCQTQVAKVTPLTKCRLCGLNPAVYGEEACSECVRLAGQEELKRLQRKIASDRREEAA
jgi:hypothetical protein